MSGLPCRGAAGWPGGFEGDKTPAFEIEHDHLAIFEAAAAGLGKVKPGAAPLRIFGDPREDFRRFLGGGRKHDSVCLNMGNSYEPWLLGLPRK